MCYFILVGAYADWAILNLMIAELIYYSTCKQSINQNKCLPALIDQYFSAGLRDYVKQSEKMISPKNKLPSNTIHLNAQKECSMSNEF